MSRIEGAVVSNPTINGIKLHIRPVSHYDVPLLQRMIDGLVTDDGQYMQYGVVKLPTAEQVKHLCKVDFHDSMAFVAVTGEGEEERELGFVQYHKDSVRLNHEMQVLISREFSATELGKLLCEQLISYAKQHGIKSLYLIDTTENTYMRKLANDLGMSVRLDSNNSYRVIYSLITDAHPHRVEV